MCRLIAAVNELLQGFPMALFIIFDSLHFTLEETEVKEASVKAGLSSLSPSGVLLPPHNTLLLQGVKGEMYPRNIGRSEDTWAEP